MNKAHTNVNWENLPSTNTPLNQQNLNQMDNAIDVIDNRVIVHDNEITQLQGYETRAAQSATAAANSASTASTKATAAATSATNSENFYKYSKSYAVGGTGIRSGEDTDNSKYYYEQVKSMASGGHAIMDSNGTAMAGRSILQFANSRVADDATNDKTIVAPAHGHTNLLNPTLGTTTINGVTCTANGDGTYTLNGTATGQGFFRVTPYGSAHYDQEIELETGKTYNVVGCPAGGRDGSSTRYNGTITRSSRDDVGRKAIAKDTGNGATFVAEDGYRYEYYILIAEGVTYQDLTFKPMLTTDLSATYDDFVQYSGDGELNENVASLYEGLESTDANLTDVQSQIVTSGNIESGNTATSAHTVGTYIQWKGKFYIVTAAIAVGDTLAVGTNLSAKTVGEVLTQINADLSSGLSSISNLISLTSGLTPTGIGYIDQLNKHFMIFNCTSSVPINSSVIMPRYTKGIFVTGGADSAAVDGFLLAVGSDAGLYVAFRNGSSWNYAKKL